MMSSLTLLRESQQLGSTLPIKIQMFTSLCPERSQVLSPVSSSWNRFFPEYCFPAWEEQTLLLNNFAIWSIEITFLSLVSFSSFGCTSGLVLFLFRQQNFCYDNMTLQSLQICLFIHFQSFWDFVHLRDEIFLSQAAYLTLKWISHSEMDWSCLKGQVSALQSNWRVFEGN